jgi:hypothetical protein
MFIFYRDQNFSYLAAKIHSKYKRSCYVTTQTLSEVTHFSKEIGLEDNDSHTNCYGIL